MSTSFRRLAATVFAAAATVACLTAQVPTEQRMILRSDRPGMFVIDKSQRGWAELALDAMALHLNKLLLSCGSFDTSQVPGRYESSGTLEFPESVAGMQQFANVAGHELIERVPNVLVLKTKEGTCGIDTPFLIFAEPLKGLGANAALPVPREKFEWKLLVTGRNKTIVPGVAQSDAVLVTYYWPSREGAGRQCYVLQKNSNSVVPDYPFGGGHLRKVAIAESGVDPVVEDLWLDEGRRQPATVYASTVADVELDFDGDGVIDVVTLNNRIGPLLIVSGRTGNQIGTLEGYEFLVTQDHTGKVKVRTMDHEGLREYALTQAGEIELLHQTKAKTSGMPPLIEQRKVIQSAAEGHERILANFVLPVIPVPLQEATFSKVRKLKILGERIRAPYRTEHLDPDARVYADYRPEPKETGARPQ